MTSDVLLYVML